jgi:hypothetical protein
VAASRTLTTDRILAVFGYLSTFVNFGCKEVRHWPCIGFDLIPPLNSWHAACSKLRMNIDKLEAALNMLVLLTIVGVVVKYTNVDASASEVANAYSQVSRSALDMVEYCESTSDVDCLAYELDAYEVCTIVDQKSDAECEAI